MEKTELRKLLEKYLPGRLNNEKKQELKTRLSGMSDISTLFAGLRSTASGSDEEVLHLARITEVLTTEILPPLISGNPTMLIYYFKILKKGSEAEKIMGDKIVPFVENISIENCPKWFEDLLNRIAILPQNLKEAVEKKAETLYDYCCT